MATITTARAHPTFPAFKSVGAGLLCAAYGSYDFAANPTEADVIEFCKVPPGAVILDGFLRLEDVDSNDTEEFDIDIGYAANGDVNADPDAFLNGGVRNGDAVTNYLPEGGSLIPFMGVLKDGPLTLTRETTITGTIIADAATFAAGTATVVVYYVCP